MPKASITSPIMAPVADIEELAASWLRHLRAARRSPRTIQSYGEAVRILREYLSARGMPTGASAIHREHVESFIEDQLERHKPATAAVRFTSLRVFFHWLVEEGEIADSPMVRMKKPKLPETVTDIPSPDDLKRVLASCKGQSFEDLRDTAILRVFMSTGARLAEVGGLRWTPDEPTTNDVGLDDGWVRLRGKGDRERVAYLDAKAVKALDRYIRRARRQHSAVDGPWLWLGKRGRFTASGISQMVRDRGEHCGVRLHPHAFRHAYADRALASGMQEGDLMALAGWRSREMLSRYGAANRSKRALAAARRIDMWDDV